MPVFVSNTEGKVTGEAACMRCYLLGITTDLFCLLARPLCTNQHYCQHDCHLASNHGWPKQNHDWKDQTIGKVRESACVWLDCEHRFYVKGGY